MLSLVPSFPKHPHLKGTSASRWRSRKKRECWVNLGPCVCPLAHTWRVCSCQGLKNTAPAWEFEACSWKKRDPSSSSNFKYKTATTKQVISKGLPCSKIFSCRSVDTCCPLLITPKPGRTCSNVPLVTHTPSPIHEGLDCLSITRAGTKILQKTRGGTDSTNQRLVFFLVFFFL